jgi:hypothetical protein
MNRLMAKAMFLFGILAVGTLCLLGRSSGASRAYPTRGSVGLGQACTGHDDCRAIAGRVVECRCTDQSSVPLCTADLQLGEDCSTTGKFSPRCEPATRCAPSGTTGPVCLPVAKVGESCDSTTAGCQDPAYCDSSQHCVVGQGELGQACAQDAECKSPYICPWGKNVCTVPARVGSPCHTNAHGRSECAAGAGCDGSRCITQKADGQACLFDEECLTGLCGINGCGRGGGAGDVTISCGS